MADNTAMFISKMTTVFSYSVSGLKANELQKALENADRDAASKVKKFVDQCKQDECKWSDPDFGPNDDDEYGAESLYGNPPKPPSGGKLIWELRRRNTQKHRKRAVDAK